MEKLQTSVPVSTQAAPAILQPVKDKERIVLCTLFFHGYGLGYFHHLEYYQLFFVVIAVWAVSLIISPIWLKHYRFGPLEWLWRSLSYRKLQPMRRELAT